MRSTIRALRQVLAQLNHLIAVCRDGQQGYETAAQAAEDPDLAAFFHDQARQRAQLAGDLAACVHRLDGEVTTAGSVTAAAHRGWMQLKAAIAQGDDKALIAECARSEDVAKREYEEALQDAWPEELERLLTSQYEAVRAAHDRIRLLAQAHR